MLWEYEAFFVGALLDNHDEGAVHLVLLAQRPAELLE
jgi:hypothetical protein